jgi:outer membrane protein TolC
VGATLTQPLLKNAGWDATYASIRVAALNSDIAFEEYRRQMMMTISTAEAAYWNLYLAEQQFHVLDESMKLAGTVLQDSRAMLESGKGSQLGVLEAESGLAERTAKRSDASMKVYSAQMQLASLYGSSPKSGLSRVRTIQTPVLCDDSVPSYAEGWETTLVSNPDLRIQRRKLAVEDARVLYMKNQKWPELNLKASYGLNGLGTSPGESVDQVERGDFPSWSVKLEFNVPLGGGIKARRDFEAARLGREEAVLALHGVETQVGNALATALHKIRGTAEIARRYETITRFNREALNSELERLKLGKVEPRKVLEVEAKLLDAQVGLADAMVQHARALIEVRLVEGMILKDRGLEVSRDELRNRTTALMQSSKPSLKTVRFRFGSPSRTVPNLTNDELEQMPVSDGGGWEIQ